MDAHEVQAPAHAASCCGESGEPQTNLRGTAVEAQRGFGTMLRAAQRGGVLDARSKELILIALVLHSRCAACFDVHYNQARHLGITDDEIEEAAWCAIVMGGAPVRMFYQECLARRLSHTAGTTHPAQRKL